ncbi:MAG: thioredoxin family protein [Flavobacteriaceae bacterium]
MKTVKILGTGCPNCKNTEAVVASVIEQLNLDLKIEKVEDIQEIMKYNIMSTPAIVIDEKVVLKGRVPSLAEAKDLLEKVSTSTCSNNNGDSCCGGHHHEHNESCQSKSQAKEGTCCSDRSHTNCC